MRSRSILLSVLLLVGFASGALAADPLPSWSDGAAKQAILSFVTRATTIGGPGFIAPTDRIATFDNDGTLWSEQPMYFQVQFALDRVEAMAPRHPEWKTTEPFKSLLAGDRNAVVAQGEKGLVQVLAAAHTGMTTDEFQEIASDWFATARHPKTKRLYTEMVFQPMLEVLAYLRANGFKTYICSGGGVEFMRAMTERVYGIPPEQVIGSRGRLRFEMRGDTPVLIKEAAIDLVDDGPGKPVGIQQMIGRRPVMAFGNSDGDQQMLEWTTSGAGPRFALIVHHTDAVREWAYDNPSSIGKLDKALIEGRAKGWTIVDMKKDWKRIYPFQK